MAGTLTPHRNLQQITSNGASRKAHLEAITTMWIDNMGWLHGPNVVHSPLPEASTQPTITPRNVILHTNAGPHKTLWTSLFKYMARTDVTGEPHFQLDGVNASVANPAELKLVQFMPLGVRADCNAKANRWAQNGKYYGAISFETQDEGSVHNIEDDKWSIPQLHTLVCALTAICATYGVSCGSPGRWSDSGIGYHSQFPEWSIYKGKTCPGAARVRQMPYIWTTVATLLAEYGERTGWKCGQTA